jgi:hypothetical protein
MTDFAGMTLNEDEAMKALHQSDLRTRKDRDSRICICGHPMSNHSGLSDVERRIMSDAGMPGKTTCTPGRMTCPCDIARPAVYADDARMFLRKTLGDTPYDHALTLGIAACKRKSIHVEWLIDLLCDRCGNPNVSIAAITAWGKIASEPSALNKLLCADCRLALM